MLATALKGVQLVLLGCVSYLAYLAISPLLGRAAVEPLALPEIPAPAVRDPAFARYQVIGERNLFKSRDVPIPIDSEREDLDESALKLRLLGTTAAARPELSVASVEDISQREVLTLRIGDTVAGAEVVGIERRRIVLENRGRREQLSLDDAPRRQPAPRAASRRARERTSAAARAPSGPAPGAQPTVPSAAALAVLLGGQDLGLANGETVTAVNGKSLADPASLRIVIDSLEGGGHAMLTVVDQDGQTRQVVRELP